MSCSKWLRCGLFAAFLCAVAACGRQDTPPFAKQSDDKPAADVDQQVVGVNAVGLPAQEVDFTKPDIGLDAELAAAAKIPFNVDQQVVPNDVVGLPAKEVDLTKPDIGLDADLAAAVEVVGLPDGGGLLAMPGLSGRSGATKESLLRNGGGGRVFYERKSGIVMSIVGPQQMAGVQSDFPAGGIGAVAGSLPPNESNTENYERIFDNPYKSVKNDPLSTISSAVDTASYSNIRARLNSSQLPPKDAVRIADMLNYFNYDYAGPKNDDPVAFSLEIAPCSWQPKHHLLRIGLKAKTIDKDKMPPRNLTFLIDTSGSMAQQNRLPLVKQSLRLLVEQLGPNDRVSIVTYAGSASVALPPTPGSEKDTILKTIDSLNAEGSTHGEGGLRVAYDHAKAGFIKEGVNRVILATDGDFNVGISSDAEMVRLIEEKRETGVYLTVLGYGMGNLKDSKLEQLAHHGNGHYAYIDTLDEAKKVFVEQGGSLVTVAKDVKLQVEFNPAKVAGYRLIGYENRVLRNEDFRNDKKDAGDMGSGHMCTALYEIVPVGEKVDSGEVEPLKYQTTPKLSDAAKSGEWATVRMRYKDPSTDKAKEVEAPLKGDALGQKASNDFEFAAAVASFGMLLRESEFKGIATYQAVMETTEGLLRDKKDPYREEFVKLVRVAFTIEQAKQKK